MAWSDKPLRFMLTAAYQLLKVNWLVRRPRTFGAHALALTPERKLILVKLRYASGWRLPGGGRSEDEVPRDAMLRELREEIGLISHGRVKLAAELEETPDFKRDFSSVFVVEEVSYRPRWSWEVEQVLETDPEHLPSGLSPITAKWLAALRDKY